MVPAGVTLVITNALQPSWCAGKGGRSTKVLSTQAMKAPPAKNGPAAGVPDKSSCAPRGADQSWSRRATPPMHSIWSHGPRMPSREGPRFEPAACSGAGAGAPCQGLAGLPRRSPVGGRILYGKVPISYTDRLPSILFFFHVFRLSILWAGHRLGHAFTTICGGASPQPCAVELGRQVDARSSGIIGPTRFLLPCPLCCPTRGRHRCPFRKELPRFIFRRQCVMSAQPGYRLGTAFWRPLRVNDRIRRIRAACFL